MNSLNSNKNNCLTFQKFIQALGGHVMYNPLHFLNTTLPVPVARCPLCPGLLPLRVCPPAASALLCPPFILPTVPTCGPGWKQPWLSGATPSLTSSQLQYSPSSSVNPSKRYQSNVQHQHTSTISYKLTLFTMLPLTTSLLSPLTVSSEFYPLITINIILTIIQTSSPYQSHSNLMN